MKDNRAMLRNTAKRALKRYSDSQKSSQISEKIDSSGRFDFDAELLSSPRYERALHYLRKMESRRTELEASSSTRQHVGLGISGPGDDLSSLRSDLYTPSFLSDDTPYSHESSTVSEKSSTDTMLGHQEPNQALSNTEHLTVPDFTDGFVTNSLASGSFMSKRRSMPPLYSQIRANASSPKSLLGLVNRAYHRRSRSEGNRSPIDS